MQGKFVFALGMLVLLVAIGSSSGCKICGNPWCREENSHVHDHDAADDEPEVSKHLEISFSAPDHWHGHRHKHNHNQHRHHEVTYCSNCGAWKSVHPDSEEADENCDLCSRKVHCKCRNKHRHHHNC